MEVSSPSFNSIVVHYGEVTLKRGKRGLFERILRRNLEKQTGAKVKRLQGRFVIDVSSEQDLRRMLEKIGKVFGVVWYAPAVKPGSLDELEQKILSELRRIEVKKVRVDTRRSDKRFPMRSIDVSRRLGESITRSLGLKIDLKNPDKTIFVEITEDGLYASFDKLKGPGGLPLDSSGKLLALLSGARSALACWYMMKRGCRVDFLHVGFESSEKSSPLIDLQIVNKLLEYSLTAKLYEVVSDGFEERVKDLSEEAKKPLFELFLLKVGGAIAESRRYPGIVLGSMPRRTSDVKNLCTILSFRRLPIYTPLLALDEEEVLNGLKSIGLEGEHVLEESGRSIEVNKRELERLWMELGLDEAVEEALRGLSVFSLRLGEPPKRIR